MKSIFPTGLCDHPEYAAALDLLHRLRAENRSLERRLNAPQPTNDSGLKKAVDVLLAGDDPGFIDGTENESERRQTYLKMIATGRAEEPQRRVVLEMEPRIKRELIEEYKLRERHEALLAAVNRAAVDFGQATQMLDEFYDKVQAADLGCALGHFGGYQISRPGRVTDPDSQINQWRRAVREAGYKL